MDKLTDMFNRQKEFDEYVAQAKELNFTKDEWLCKRALALNVELSEFIQEVNYKWWKLPKEENSAAMKEELIDVFHFFLGLCIEVGMTPDEFYEIYINKLTENYNRQKGLSSKKGYAE